MAKDMQQESGLLNDLAERGETLGSSGRESNSEVLGSCSGTTDTGGTRDKPPLAQGIPPKYSSSHFSALHHQAEALGPSAAVEGPTAMEGDTFPDVSALETSRL